MTLVSYLSRIFFKRFLAVLLALSALVLLLEMLEALRRLVGSSSSLENVFTFTLLRLPLALEQLFLIAVLTGAVLTLRQLAKNNELVILRGAGLSPYRLLASLLPVTAILAIVHYGNVDRLAPAADRAFTNWWNQLAPPSDNGSSKNGVLWLRSGSEIILVGRVENEGRMLSDVVRFVRDAEGQLKGRIAAASVRFEGQGWRMFDVEVITAGDDVPSRDHQDALDWPSGPPPRNFQELTLPTSRTSADESRSVLTGEWSGAASTAHYRTLVQKSYAAAALPFLMLLLAAPALGGGRRIGGMKRGPAISMLAGLSFIVTNGLFTSMSEANVVPAALAVWSTPAAFLALGMAILLYCEE